MLTIEQNEQLTRVGPGTPMGEMLRRYWHPVAATAQLLEPGTRLVKLLGETLVLYRDQTGRLGLVGSHCAHRSAGLLYGVPEAEGLRCSYHGWMYDSTGQCIAQPFEQTVDPSSTFHERIRIPAYPVQELGGVIFAYLGPAPTPLLPRWDMFLDDDVAKDVGICFVPCNWLQVMENSCDPQHSEWLHTHLDNYVLGRLGQDKWIRPQLVHVDVGFDRSEYGIIKRRQRGGVTKEHEMWALGHSMIFPLAEKAGNTTHTIFFLRVPVDDTHTMEFSYCSYRDVPKRHQVPPVFDVPCPRLELDGGPPYEDMSAIVAQDILMWYSQGELTNRGAEHLGRGDRGVILFREMLAENLKCVERGEDPMNVFRDPAHNQRIELAVERDKALRGPWRPGIRRAGVTKYSVILGEYEEEMLLQTGAGVG